MRTSLLTLPLLIATLALAACGGADKVGSGDGTTAPPTSAIAHPTGSRDIILQVASGGGFVPAEVNLAQVPQFTLYGDGTVIVGGVVPAIYPGPAIWPLVTGKLDEAKVQSLLEAAKAAGLLVGAPLDLGDMGSIGISDAPTTSLVIHAGGVDVTHSAYALGIEGAQVPAAQAAARETLNTFIGSLTSAAATAPFVPQALSAYVGAYQGDPQPGAAPIVWPLGADLAKAGDPVSSGLAYRCIAVTGADVAPILDALAKANSASQWIAAADRNATFGLVVRPALRGETPCATPGA